MADDDMTLYVRRKYTPPPSVLLLTSPNNKDRHYGSSPLIERRSRQKKNRFSSRINGLYDKHLDSHETLSSSLSWQRYSDKIGRITPAPDIAYRNTYLEETKRDKLDINNGYYHSRSSSPYNYQSSRIKLNNSSESLQQKHRSLSHRKIYDCILNSIRQIEQKRNIKPQNIFSRIERPQNEDSTLRRVLAEKKPLTRSSLLRKSSASTRTISPLFNNDLKSPQSFVNYINHSRVRHSITPNQSYQQRSILS